MGLAAVGLRRRGQDGGEIEPEAVYVHHLHPITQTVYDHAPDDGMIGVERVAGAGVVGVARLVGFEDVVRAVVHAAETQCGPLMVAFSGVVEHHAENDLDPRPCSALTISRNSFTGPSAAWRALYPGAAQRRTQGRSPSS